MLTVCNMNVFFKNTVSRLHVVRGIDFTLKSGSRMAILGETGCGKSVMAMALFRLLPNNSRTTGSVVLNGEKDILTLPESAMKRLRGDRMVLVPQNPTSYLNPVFSVGFHLKESIRRTENLSRGQIFQKALLLLSRVGFKDPDRVHALFPHQLSGGMAQRVLLAIGLAADPFLIVLDEPTRGLDIQARDRYIALSAKLYRKAAFLMITHDLAVAQSCTRVMVMYAGKCVEEGSSESVLETPRHPYTRGLILAHPSNGFIPIPGMPPLFSKPITGCAFSNRCNNVGPLCHKASPPIQYYEEQTIRCHYA